MSQLYSRAIRVGLFCGAALIASSASAQSAAPSDSEASVDESAGGLGEIIVTARKTTERAQDTPISLTVASGEQLQNRSVTQLVDLQGQTPSLHMAPSALSSTSPALSSRGQSLTDIRLNVDPAIGIYVDGVYLPRAQGANGAALVDIDRVEVLAGPQGTLYGKNTTGGALVIYTKAPTQDFEGSLGLRYGSFGEHSITGILNVPIGSTVAARVAANVTGRDGYGRNFTTGARPGELNSRMFRGAISFDPTPDLNITLRGDYTRVKATTEAYHGFQTLAAPTPGVGNGAPSATIEAVLELNNIATVADFNALPTATRTTLINQADSLLRSYSQGNPSDAYGNISAGENTEIWGTSATIDLDVSDSLSLKSITAYREFTRRGTADLDGTPFSIFEYPYMRTTDHQFSQEVQLIGKLFDDRLTLVTGLYYSDESGVEHIHQTALQRVAGVNNTTFQEAEVGNKSFGVFAQGNLKLTESLTFTGGIRYSEDNRAIDAHTRNATFCTALGVTLASIGGAENCSRDMKAKFDKISYTVGLDYKIARDVMIYAKTSHGYRAGGLQQNAGGTTQAVADAVNQPFNPETVTDYEIGLKSQFFDRRLRLNLAYYHAIEDDAIRTVSFPVPGTSAIASRALNAAKAKIDGVEFDATMLLAEGLELGVNGAYTDARFVRYVTPTGEDRSYLPLLFTPKWQVGVSAAYTATFDWGKWRLQGNFSHTGRQLTNETRGFSPKHDLVDLRTSVTIDSLNLDVAAYVKNLTNERYRVWPVDLVAGFGFIYNGIFSPPRTYGLEVTKRF